jgi:hypothetical protein
MIDKAKVLILSTWALFAISSIPFDRIQDDEVIYFVEATRILTAGPTVFNHLIVVPLVLGAVAASAWASILAVRIVSSLAVLLTAVLIAKVSDDDSSMVASMLYLTSFYTVRFGFRFYLDPFGGLFSVAAIYFLYKNRSKLVGASATLAALSREMAAPLLLAFALLTYVRRLGLGKYLLGALVIGIPSLIWIYLAVGIQTAVTANIAGFVSDSSFGFNSIGLTGIAWVEYVLLSPLVVAGVIVAGGIRARAEFYPGVFSVVVLSLTPGFIVNGAASEYPYILNSIFCVIAGVGLVRIARKLNLGRRMRIGGIMSILIIQFVAQSYAATSLSPNGVVGTEDFGFWNDQLLLTYLDNNYHGGFIYSATQDGLLDQKLAANWVWTPQTIQPALRANPPWVVTFSSYVKLGPIPSGVTVETIGPFIVVHQNGVPLSSFMTPTNRSNWTI